MCSSPDRPRPRRVPPLLRAWRRLVPLPLERRLAAALGYRPSPQIDLEAPFSDEAYGFDEEDAVRAAVERVRSGTMCSLERLAALWNNVRYIDRARLDGALVECGVWKGGAAALMSLAHSHNGSVPTRALHLFDSFQGLPEPTEADGAKASVYARGRASGRLESIDRCVGLLDEVRRCIEGAAQYPRELVHYHLGWFQETVPSTARFVGPIALLHLDGDWYDSTRVCLEHLYPLVVRGGIVHVDDYGHWEGCRRAVDEYLGARNEVVMLTHVDYTGRYWVKLSASPRSAVEP